MFLIVADLSRLDCYVSREFAYIIRGLVSVHGWRHVDLIELMQAPGTLRDRLLARFGTLPEAILFWETYAFLNENEREIDRLGCLKAIVADDLHRLGNDPRRWRQMLSYMIVDVVFATYGYAVHEFFPEVRDFSRCVWLPHSASPDFQIPFNPTAENALLLSGSLHHCYTLRRQLKALYDRGQPGIVHHPHPGYEAEIDHEGDQRVAVGYARTIHRYRAAFTDGSVYRYTVAKHFEIPATGALLVADRALAGPLKALGFVEGETYVSTSAADLEHCVRDVLDGANFAELDAVRKRAQALVWERHKSSDRAAQIDEVCRSAL